MPDTPVEPSGSGRYPADMESRVAVLEQIARTTAASLERIEHRFDTLEGRFDTLESRFTAMDGRFTGLESRFAAVDRRFDALSSEHRADFRWLLGLMLAQTGALLGVMAHGFHWL
jgi:hypothetical protein